MSRKEEYLEKIREMSGLKHAILSMLRVDRYAMSVEFVLITDRAYTAQEAEKARQISLEFVPHPFIAETRIVKRLPDEE